MLASRKTNAIKSPDQDSISLQDDREWRHLYTLITSYASRALTGHLLPALSPALPFLSLSLLPSLLTQLTYCSTAFARVGLDFRGILSNLFSQAVEEVVKRDMTSARDNFVAKFQLPSKDSTTQNRVNNSGRTTRWELPSKWLLGSATGTAAPPMPVTPATPLSAAPLLSQGPPHIPPQILALYPPVAEFTNALLSILNGLRLLAPISILTNLSRMLDDEILFRSGEAVLIYIRTYYGEYQASPNGIGNAEGSEETEKAYQRRVTLAFGQVFFKVFAPFMRRALVEGVYSTKLDASFQGGKLLPGVVMDWEDFSLENGEEEESEEESSEEDEGEGES